MPIGATIAAVGSVASAGVQAYGAGQASKAASDAQKNTLDFTKGVYNDTSRNVAPTIAHGTAAGDALAGLTGIGGDPAAAQTAFDNYRNSTNYQFQLDQGLKAVKTGNAPAFYSGQTAKALNDYAQGQAGSALAGYEGILQGQQQQGTTAALGLGGVGVGSGQIVNSANQTAAGTQGAAAMSTANSTTNALSNLTKALTQGATASSFSKGGGGAFANDNPALDSQLAGLGIYG